MFLLTYLLKIRDIIIISLYASLVFLVSFQVIARFVFNIPAAWAEELARSIFIYTVFISGSLAIERKVNVSFDLILDSLQGKLWIRMYTVSFILNMIFISMMAFFGVLLMQKNAISVSPLLKIPVWQINLAIPLGACLMFITQIMVYIQVCKEKISENKGG